MTAIALPRIRVRRKKLKPPRPQFWEALFWVTLAFWCIFCCTWGVLKNIQAGLIVLVVWDGAMLGLWSWILRREWRTFIHEWRIWRDDQ